MNISPYEFEKAKEGSLFIKRKGKLVPVSIDELVDPLKNEVGKIGELEHKVNIVAKSLGKLKKFSKSHFIVAFALFVARVYTGEVEIEDESIWSLDNKVFKNEITVEEAVNSHPYLAELFNNIYDDKDYESFEELGGE